MGGLRRPAFFCAALVFASKRRRTDDRVGFVAFRRLGRCCSAVNRSAIRSKARARFMD